MDAIQKVTEIFKKKKNEAEYNATINKLKIFENEEIKNLYNKCKTLSYEIAKAEYLHKDTKHNLEIFKETKEILYEKLNKNGVNIKSLYPKYECEKCKDTGYTNGQYCECFKRALSKELLSQSRLSDNNLPDFDNMSFDIIKNDTQKVKYETISKTLKDYINLIPNNKKHIITICGEVGVGKTYLLKACTNEAIKKNIYCLYTTAFSLNQDMLKYHLSSMEEKKDILEKYLSCELLCIDDLGTENSIKNVTVEYLYLIINERLQASKNTIITTNLGLQQIMQNYDERIFSRIANKQECILFNMTGDDLRLSGK